MRWIFYIHLTAYICKDKRLFATLVGYFIH
nr:MAG TPA: hypothetical protein [Caudoviricetes sp.]